MKDGYLLDTNVISVLARPNDPRWPAFEQEVKVFERVTSPVITIAEIQFGMAKADNVDEAQRDEVQESSSVFRSIWDFRTAPSNRRRNCVPNCGGRTGPEKSEAQERVPETCSTELPERNSAWMSATS